MKKWQSFSEESIRQIAEISTNTKDFLSKLGYKKCYGNTLSEIIQAYPNLDLSRFVLQEQQVTRKINNPLFEDLTGQTFNHLTVLQQGVYTKGKLVQWICRCDCGNITRPIRAAHLKDGHTKSCGCLQSKRTQELARNLQGEQFGLLKVIKKDETKINYEHGAFWICQCQCGNIVSVQSTSLTSGGTRSCGCLKSSGEQLIKKILQDNNISYIQEYNFPDLLSEIGNRLRFDFAIFNENNTLQCLIEYQGEQHFKPIEYFGGQKYFEKVQQRDKKKKEYCQQKGIKLITIDYKDYNKIDDIFLKKLIWD